MHFSGKLLSISLRIAKCFNVLYLCILWILLADDGSWNQWFLRGAFVEPENDANYYAFMVHCAGVNSKGEIIVGLLDCLMQPPHKQIYCFFLIIAERFCGMRIIPILKLVGIENDIMSRS